MLPEIEPYHERNCLSNYTGKRSFKLAYVVSKARKKFTKLVIDIRDVILS